MPEECEGPSPATTWGPRSWVGGDAALGGWDGRRLGGSAHCLLDPGSPQGPLTSQGSDGSNWTMSPCVLKHPFQCVHSPIY